ncbi:MAG: ABC transporter ATP-binding protein/permease [Lachnospiraceae bacterium]|nr:ABC transporter ATP-binding protein/permease [Lachnospiraceae bacterium]
MSPKVIKQLNSILDKGQKLKIAGLMVMILIGGLLETAGVSLVVPLISAIMDEESFAANEYVVYCRELLHIDNIRTLIYLLIAALILMFIIKNAYLVLLTYLQSRFVNKNRSRCTTNLLSQFLHRPYEYYLYAETSVIIRTIYGDMDNVFNLLLQCMNLAAELVVSVCLGVFLLIIDFKMMIVVVGLLGITTLIIMKVIKPRLSHVGDRSREEQAGLYKWILQPVTGIKDVKVLAKEDYCTDRYREKAKKYADYQVVNNVLSNLPRQLLETVAIVGILGYVGISMAAGVSTSRMIPLISAFGLAAMRLLPSVNRVNTYMANIAYYEPALDYIYANIDTAAMREQEEIDRNRRENPNTTELTLKKEIRLKGITFAYPNTSKNIFTDAEMVIPVGKSVGVVGPSGSGKTTIIDILLGLLKIQAGTVTSDGRDIMSNYAMWLSHVGYIPQSIYMLDASIRENIAFGVEPDKIDDERVWKVLEQAQMKTFVEEQPDGLDSMIGERGVRISGGQRQRLGIARALYHDPELLIFDEATSALDNDTETAIMEAIDALHGQKTLVIIAHRLRTIENCDLIYEVKDEKIRLKK